MKKQFKYPLAIEGTEDETRALVPKLEELGYKLTQQDTGDKWFGYLITGLLIGDNRMTTIMHPMAERTSVSASNPDLVLALAACVDSEELYAGEWCVFKSGFNNNCFTQGKLYKARKNGWGEAFLFKGDHGRKSGYCGSNKDKFRKATKEEIINYFTMEKETTKKLKGYKLNGRVTAEQAARALGCSDKINEEGLFFWKDCLHEDPSDSFKFAKESGLLELWFDEVWEEKFKVGEWYRDADGEDFVVVGSSDKDVTIHYARNNVILTRCILYFKGCTQITREEGLFRVGNWITHPERGTGQIVKMEDHGGVLRVHTFPSIAAGGHGAFQMESCTSDKCTLATPEEIEAATKPQVKIITLRSSNKGTFEIEVSKEGIYYRPDNVYLNFDELKRVTTFNKVITGSNGCSYNFIPVFTHVHSGCYKDVPIEDWKKVIEAAESFK